MLTADLTSRKPRLRKSGNIYWTPDNRRLGCRISCPRVRSVPRARIDSQAVKTAPNAPPNGACLARKSSWLRPVISALGDGVIETMQFVIGCNARDIAGYKRPLSYGRCMAVNVPRVSLCVWEAPTPATPHLQSLAVLPKFMACHCVKSVPTMHASTKQHASK